MYISCILSLESNVQCPDCTASLAINLHLEFSSWNEEMRMWNRKRAGDTPGALPETWAWVQGTEKPRSKDTHSDESTGTGSHF